MGGTMQMTAAQLAELQAQQTSPNVAIDFDGRRFIVPQKNLLLMPMYLELAFRARRGDESAVLALKACPFFALPDDQNVNYWPMPIDAPPADTGPIVEIPMGKADELQRELRPEHAGSELQHVAGDENQSG
jgi:hypothetical protein